MFFRRRGPSGETALDRWRAFAARLELLDAGDVAERIRRWLDLGEAELAPVYLLQREGVPAVYLYDVHTSRKGPSGTVRLTRRACLVRSEGALSGVAFRAWPRQNPVLESLEASRSGAVRVAVPADPPFDAAVSVFARDARGPLVALGPAVRDVLSRLLVGRGAPGARVVVGERHLVASFDAEASEDLALLEAVLADTLALVALLPSAGRPPPAAAEPEAAPARRPEVSISPDDLLELH